MKTWILLAGAVSIGCGGTTVVEPGQGSGGAGSGAGGSTATSGASTSSSSSSSSGSSASSSTASGSSSCQDHTDCPGGVCIFSTGQCAPACRSNACDDCGPGLVCSPCATSSCPVCNDCVAACAPKTPGTCDDSDPCPPGEACHYPSGSCMPLCTPDGGCADPNMSCAECATGSCCGCENCVSLCMFLDGNDGDGG